MAATAALPVRLAPLAVLATLAALLSSAPAGPKPETYWHVDDVNAA